MKLLILRKLCISAVTIALLTGCTKNDTPLGTEIFIASLTPSQSGSYELDDYQQVTDRAGYDNQPYFLPDGSGLLYTSMLATASGTFQTDSFKYTFLDDQHKNLTNSTLSEYSPLLLADGTGFSTVVVEGDQKQRLWSHTFNGEQESKRIDDVEPVGYHAWGKEGDLAMFVLGEPSTLQFRAGKTQQLSVVANNIGRSLRHVALRNAFSFTQFREDEQWWLSEFDAQSLNVTALVPMLKGADYYTWIDAQTAVTAVGTQLYTWRYTRDEAQRADSWRPWVNVEAVCATNVSRLAVNALHSKLAFVCDE